jgi:hypothetical protein
VTVGRVAFERTINDVIGFKGHISDFSFLHILDEFAEFDIAPMFRVLIKDFEQTCEKKNQNEP